MPELPEVETIVRDLARMVPGARLGAVEVLRPDLIEGDTPAAFAAGLKGAQVGSVTRRAKNIVFGLGKRGRLVVNLGMTGRLVVGPAEEAPPYLGVRIGVGKGRALLYTDARRFGRLRRMTDDAWREWEGALGVEPLSAGFTAEWLLRECGRSRVAVKTWLMDQARVVGVGNIYASEALFRAGVDPRRPARSITADEAERIRAGVRDVLEESIEFRGTTFLDYRDAEGRPGEFVTRLRVYDRAGLPCPACGAPVSRVVQGGRSTFYCEGCQH